MSNSNPRHTPFWHLWQLLAPRAAACGKEFEAEIRRLGVLGLQFATVVAILLPSFVFLVEVALWYVERPYSWVQLLVNNLENLAIVSIGISGLALSRTSFGRTAPNVVVIICLFVAETIATFANILQGNPAYPPFIIALLILTAVVPLRAIAVAAMGLLMIVSNFVMNLLMSRPEVRFSEALAGMPLSFYLAITLVCTGLTTMIYQLRLRNFQNLQALRDSQARLQKELAVASVIQMHSLPHRHPVVPGLSVAGACVSATEIGGDYFDYLELGGDKLGILVGDVSGKGTSAALYMSKLQGIVRALNHLQQSPAQLLATVNDLLFGTIERNSFITLTYALFDLRQRCVRMSRAGHNATLYCRNGTVSFLAPPGVGLGLSPRQHFERYLQELVLPLHSQEVLVFYTDGVTDARNLSGEEFGEDRLAETVTTNLHLDARALCQRIMEEVKKFIGYARQYDDMTVLVAKVD
ncbi:MAG: PP2C family protein-serine/threonine phosphatase [candidate division KSB1 bacterium]|nr:PP2C family protein-serine/threonine phosphatase [candidate division KSB1 bacterium]MDZ7275513.1 PP2C family protein-serine/threonine phosphatase [candidate division KSB1 bacterium]MDZ7286175.1 PP2C family protein-serine/threonine phosphatase [candidate division KSB1 bacterium]MDZ7296401.1 PP2C family protein-serine/threonine phosphatase [candidate division KSB1 bacterium]MDZ7306236.1 PP2C family protein-serine/threonine phosphatase [candidate division KSB1 bacterium]